MPKDRVYTDKWDGPDSRPYFLTTGICDACPDNYRRF